MKDLIAKLEAATEGSRKLDAAIQYALTEEIAIDLPRYTTSLDAALTLLPAGYLLELSDDGFGPVGHMTVSGCTAELSNELVTHQGIGESRPLALCIAALKARSAQ